MESDNVRLKGRGRRDGEQGFTLPEVLITIVIMGILFGIATSSWFGVVEGRAVDSATNQVAADLRLAHTRATNQLVDWGVATDIAASGLTPPVGVPAGDYYVFRIPSSGVLALSDIAARELPDEGAETEIDPSTPLAMTFDPTGAAQAVGPGVSTMRVHVRGDSYDDLPNHDIEVNTTTSRVSIDP